MIKKINKKVAFIVVNWNGKRFLKDCFDSIFNQTYFNYDVYFVDNGSTDGSSDYVSENYPKIKIIQLDRNTGFAKGNNIGIRKALKDKDVNYIMALNNDTKLNNNFLEKILENIDDDKKIGAITPKIKFFYEPELIDSVGILIHPDGGGLNRGNREVDSGQFDKKEEVFGACGGAALYSREMLEDIREGDDFFDEIFFAYYEDLDLAWRARLKGWKTITCPEAIVHHIHSATAISYSSFKAFHVNRNRFFVIIKNYPFWIMLKALFILTPIRYLHLFNSIRTKKGPSHKLRSNTSIFEPVKIVLRGWISVVRFLPKMIKKRFIIQKSRVIKNEEVGDWFEKYSAKMEDMIYK